MDFSSIPLLNMMNARLQYMSQRQGVLAQNVANADTPGYQAMDIPEPDFKKMVGGNALTMTATNPRHITNNATGTVSGAVKRASTYERNPNGNNVVIEEEMAKIGQNQIEYQKVLGLYGKMISLFKTAIGNPGGA